MRSMVLIECENGSPVNGALCAVQAAKTLGPLVIVACGSGAKQAADYLGRLLGVERVVVALPPDEISGSLRAESLAPFLVTLFGQLDCTHLLSSSGAWARALLPRVAALMNVMAFSDVVAVVDSQTFTRPVHAGAALMSVRSTDPFQVFSVRPSAFVPADVCLDATSVPTDIVTVDLGTAISSSLVQRIKPVEGADVELIGARIVVSGGRGVGSVEGFSRIRPLAALLGAAVGASRAAVDAGYAAADSQVGQTGKSVAPELYIALGISGAMQHWAGMKDSKVIVAINKDPEAPIFQFSDYGVVADLFDFLPEFEKSLSQSTT